MGASQFLGTMENVGGVGLPDLTDQIFGAGGSEAQAGVEVNSSLSEEEIEAKLLQKGNRKKKLQRTKKNKKTN